MGYQDDFIDDLLRIVGEGSTKGFTIPSVTELFRTALCGSKHPRIAEIITKAEAKHLTACDIENPVFGVLLAVLIFEKCNPRDGVELSLNVNYKTKGIEIDGYREEVDEDYWTDGGERIDHLDFGDDMSTEIVANLLLGSYALKEACDPHLIAVLVLFCGVLWNQSRFLGHYLKLSIFSDQSGQRPRLTLDLRAMYKDLVSLQFEPFGWEYSYRESHLWVPVWITDRNILRDSHSDSDDETEPADPHNTSSSTSQLSESKTDASPSDTVGHQQLPSFWALYDDLAMYGLDSTSTFPMSRFVSTTLENGSSQPWDIWTC